MWKAFVIFALLDGSPLAAVAADDVGPKHHHKIPDEAFAACVDHSEGAACTVTMHDKTRDGVCKASHEDQKLFCIPPHRPQPPPP